MIGCDWPGHKKKASNAVQFGAFCNHFIAYLHACLEDHATMMLFTSERFIYFLRLRIRCQFSNWLYLWKLRQPTDHIVH